MFERMFRPCGVTINARRVHAGSPGMLNEPETPQAGDALARHCLAALCPGNGVKPGKTAHKLLGRGSFLPLGQMFWAQDHLGTSKWMVPPPQVTLTPS